MSVALEVMKLIFAVFDVSFNSGHYTVIIKWQFLYINICSFSTIFTYMLALVHDFLELSVNVTETGKSKFNIKAKKFLVWWQLIKVEICEFVKYWNWSDDQSVVRYNSFQFLKTKGVPKFKSRSRDHAPWPYLI